MGHLQGLFYNWIHKKLFPLINNFFTWFYFRPDPFHVTVSVRVNESERLNNYVNNILVLPCLVFQKKCCSTRSLCQ